jgi:hypothetical protein
MLLFLPLHVVYIFREKQVAGKMWTAVLRLIAQFGLIGLANEMATDGAN